MLCVVAFVLFPFSLSVFVLLRICCRAVAYFVGNDFVVTSVALLLARFFYRSPSRTRGGIRDGTRGGGKNELDGGFGSVFLPFDTTEHLVRFVMK